jgi:hypothetical protein
MPNSPTVKSFPPVMQSMLSQTSARRKTSTKEQKLLSRMEAACIRRRNHIPFKMLNSKWVVNVLRPRRSSKKRLIYILPLFALVVLLFKSGDGRGEEEVVPVMNVTNTSKEETIITQLAVQDDSVLILPWSNLSSLRERSVGSSM